MAASTETLAAPLTATADAPQVVLAPVPSGPEQNREHASQIDKMRDHFASQPKRRIRVQEEQFLQVNGYSFRIMPGDFVHVPEQIAQMLEDSGRI